MPSPLLNAPAQNHTQRIVQLCLKIDETAKQVYTTLASGESNPELKKFWVSMAKEEEGHVAFWKKVCVFGDLQCLPCVFERPDEIVAELEELVPRAERLLDDCKKVSCIEESFLAAYRLEFYMLHPAFETLFSLLRGLVDEACPEDEYENHIAGFIRALTHHGNVTPAMELLGETLQRLWRENKLLAERATRDALTGCLTRQAFNEIAAHFAFLAQRQEQTLAVMMIDLDNFKLINDQHGHYTGDRILQASAECIRANLRQYDVVGRYGGEEFVVCMPGVTVQGAVDVAERIRMNFATMETEGVRATLSIGLVVSEVKEGGEDVLKKMFNLADLKLYKAKRQGRNRVVV